MKSAPRLVSSTLRESLPLNHSSDHQLPVIEPFGINHFRTLSRNALQVARIFNNLHTLCIVKFPVTLSKSISSALFSQKGGWVYPSTSSKPFAEQAPRCASRSVFPMPPWQSFLSKPRKFVPKRAIRCNRLHSSARLCRSGHAAAEWPVYEEPEGVRGLRGFLFRVSRHELGVGPLKSSILPPWKCQMRVAVSSNYGRGYRLAPNVASFSCRF